MILAIELEFYLLEVEDDVGHVFDHARKGGEFMLRASDFCCSDGSAFLRGKQDAPEGIPHGVSITGLKWLGGEFGVSIGGCALVFGESFRHFKTTVTDWHLIFSNVDFRLTIEDRERADNRNSKILNRNSFYWPGSPWRVRFHVQRRKPRDQRRDYKNSLRSVE